MVEAAVAMVVVGWVDRTVVAARGGAEAMAAQVAVVDAAGAMVGSVLVEGAEDLQEGSVQMVVVRAVAWKVVVGAAEV